MAILRYNGRSMQNLIKKHKKIIIFTIIVIVVIALLILFFQSKHPFSRRLVRDIQNILEEFGDYSPVAVVALIVVSTLIPPLPLPVPLIELAAGIELGFWKGLLICLIAQAISSCLAFWFARFIGKRIAKRFTKSKFFDFYKDYLKRSGPKAVLIMRATMLSPFNVVSYLAGLTEMKFWPFLAATVLGSIPEAVLFTFVGSQIKHIR